MKRSYEIHGYCDPGFIAVKDAFIKNFEDQLETGASFAATVNGKYVVDLWGGFSDAAETIAWEKDTITCVYSTTKVMTALCALILVDRGLLDINRPVADYWPEFAKSGKDKIKVRWLLSHSSGLSGFDKPLSLETMYDWGKSINMLENQAPWWEPGTASGYHMFTFGYLVGELIRRVSGKSPGIFFRDEVAIPLNADFHIGLAKENDVRVAELIPPAPVTPPPLDPDSIMMKTFFNSPLPMGYSCREWRGAEIPSTNGHGNARSAARVGSLLACSGELDGLRLLSKSTVDLALEEQFNGIDLVMGIPMRWGLGFGLAGELLNYSGSRSFYWSGLGGSWLEMDPDNRMCFSYVMNKLVLDPEGDQRILSLRDALFKVMKHL